MFASGHHASMKMQCAEQSGDWGPRERYNGGGYGAVGGYFRSSRHVRQHTPRNMLLDLTVAVSGVGKQRSGIPGDMGFRIAVSRLMRVYRLRLRTMASTSRAMASAI